jgi:O-acetyl-ADP-ribose deacetylase (regulator of RNase III)
MNPYSKLKVRRGDITLIQVDAIVNAANTSLLGGGGVDGAIHRAAGPGLLKECSGLGGCPTGEARITAGHNLKAKFVIHTPGPVYKDGTHGEAALLKSCYINCMRLAMENNVLSIAFPAISTGVYNYPKQEACEIAVNTVTDFMRDNNYFPEVFFVLFDSGNFKLYESGALNWFGSTAEMRSS